MIRYVLAYSLSFVLGLGCSPENEIRTVVGDEGNSLHLVPFSCAYLGIEISELSGCSIACPAALLSSYDLERFTQKLECTHPRYSLLQCGLDI